MGRKRLISRTLNARTHNTLPRNMSPHRYIIDSDADDIRTKSMVLIFEGFDFEEVWRSVD